ncbi:hypothetical protein [Nitrosospira multiformis]|uniref:Uncharacterized protein n=1 Tax=Nitrosospira multiformis TaxID=1231 RepID=A0A1I7HDG7_9PROT|nr:hypothetical protein [Nitrosospira multiformis]SFU58770.1 hypothetical protein SAMN05216417_108112 [Nitrosospira multiformis]
MSYGNNRDRTGILGRDNEGWRSLWTLETISRTAVHRSGMVVRITRLPGNPTRDHLTLEHPVDVDVSGWELGEIAEEAMALWMEGSFERGEMSPGST